ncbi:hypothetical protein BFP70_15675 [Thioclava sp. SK-1]|uniref:GGDEF domain-containing protein n=1 Tax=Thioclava sp. SK-1 TaxID=1889770 RepID=UPI00082576D9|nr:GGDEF domain-containing protein [Thioclava sp. SK-1]OCX60912.1 hypothetical protein BFP70_15675 [Thioclava sp. SK-1]
MPRTVWRIIITYICGSTACALVIANIIAYLVLGRASYADLWPQASLITFLTGTLTGMVFFIHLRPYFLASYEQHLASQRDFLTGIDNRSRFYARMSTSMAPSTHRGKNTQTGVIIAIDIDYFKAINDNFGHSGGDAVLIAVAHGLRDHSRATGFVARFGGDEFMMALPDHNMQDGIAIAEHMRDAIANMAIETRRGTACVTASFGVVPYRCEECQVDDVLHRADTALYDAKANGRNCVVWRVGQ